LNSFFNSNPYIDFFIYILYIIEIYFKLKNYKKLCILNNIDKVWTVFALIMSIFCVATIMVLYYLNYRSKWIDKERELWLHDDD
jgi:hypothetical protein